MHLPVQAMQLGFGVHLQVKTLALLSPHPIATALLLAFALWRYMAFSTAANSALLFVCLFIPWPLQCIASSGGEKHVELLVSQSVLGQQLTQPFSKTPPAPSHPAALPCALEWGVMKDNFVVEYSFNSLTKYCYSTPKASRKRPKH